MPRRLPVGVLIVGYASDQCLANRLTISPGKRPQIRQLRHLPKLASRRLHLLPRILVRRRAEAAGNVSLPSPTPPSPSIPLTNPETRREKVQHQQTTIGQPQAPTTASPACPLPSQPRTAPSCTASANGAMAMSNVGAARSRRAGGCMVTLLRSGLGMLVVGAKWGGLGAFVSIRLSTRGEDIGWADAG